MQISTEWLKYYYRVQKKINALSIAGRAAVLIGTLLVILLIWYVLIQRPQIAHQHKVQEQLNAIISESEESVIEINDIIEKITGKTIENEKEELNEKSKEIEQYLSVLNDEIIAPDQMTEILQKMLTHYSNLKLTSFKISPKRILVNSGEQQHKIQLYEQDVKLELRGNYFSTLDYLKELEHLPWRFFWDDIQYTVIKYPEAAISIKIHTLGK